MSKIDLSKNSVTELQSILYGWYDKLTPKQFKMGDHSVIGNPGQAEIERQTRIYIRGTLNTEKYRFDSVDVYGNPDRVIVHFIINITDYAKVNGKNYVHAKNDDFIRLKSYLLNNARIRTKVENKIKTGDFYRLTADEVISEVNRVITGNESKLNFLPTRFQVEAEEKAYRSFVEFQHRKFLLDCTMRFGKCFTAYSIAKRLGAKNILILTGRPKISDGWRRDLEHTNFGGSTFVTTLGQEIPVSFSNDGGVTVIFASFQGAKHNHKIGLNEVKSTLKNVINQDIDLVIIDEAHAYLSPSAIDFIAKLNAKYELWVSGTPFKAYELGMFNGVTDTYCFTLIDMLVEKRRVENLIKNGVAVLEMDRRMTEFPWPQILVAEHPKYESVELSDQNLRFSLLLSSSNGVANYQQDVTKLLYQLFNSSLGKRALTNLGNRGKGLAYPITGNCIWIVVPAGKDDNDETSVAAGSVISNTILSDPYLNSIYAPLVIKGDKTELNVSHFIIDAKNAGKKPVIISCRSLNTGTTFPDIDTIIFLTETSSVSDFLQTVGRAMNPKKGKKHITVICYGVEMVVTMINKMVEYSIKDGQTHNKVMSELLELMPIFTSEVGIKRLDIEKVYAELSSKGSFAKSFGEKTLLDADFDCSEFTEALKMTGESISNTKTLFSGVNEKGKNKLTIKGTIEKIVISRSDEEKIRDSILEMFRYIGTIIVLSFINDDKIITSLDDLKRANHETVDSIFFPGANDLLLSILASGKVKTEQLDRKISAFYNVEMKNNI